MTASTVRASSVTPCSVIYVTSFCKRRHQQASSSSHVAEAWWPKRPCLDTISLFTARRHCWSFGLWAPVGPGGGPGGSGQEDDGVIRSSVECCSVLRWVETPRIRRCLLSNVMRGCGAGQRDRANRSSFRPVALVRPPATAWIRTVITERSCHQVCRLCCWPPPVGVCVGGNSGVGV